MKTKIFFLLLLICPMSVNAQDDERALAAAVDTIVRKFTEADIVNSFVDEIFEKHRSAYLATRIAKSYYNYNENAETKMRDFHSRDTVQAFKYIRRSIGIDPKYAQAYVVASDILSYEKGTAGRDEAMAWLNRGIAYNPQDSALYIASAEMLAYTDEDAAVAKMEALREANPSFPTDLYLGRLFFKIYDTGGQDALPRRLEKMATYYGRVSMTEMDARDLGAYAMALQYTGNVIDNNFDKMRDVSAYGIQKYPDNISLRKSFFTSLWSLKQWEEAVKAGKEMLAVADSSQVGIGDYNRLSQALRNAKQYDEAIALSEKILQMSDASENNKQQAQTGIALAVSDKAKNFSKQKEFQKAIDVILPYVEKYQTEGGQNDNIVLAYADTYRDWGTTLTGPEQEEKYYQAAKIYAQGIAGSKVNKILFAYRQYETLVQMDMKAELGMAIPAVEELEAIAKTEALEDPSVMKRLYNPYRYVLYYSLNKNNYAKAVEYAEKIVEIEPSDQGALNVITTFGSKVKKKR